MILYCPLASVPAVLPYTVREYTPAVGGAKWPKMKNSANNVINQLDRKANTQKKGYQKEYPWGTIATNSTVEALHEVSLSC